MVKPSHGQVHQQKLQPKLPENCSGCQEKPTNNHSGHTGLAELEEQWSPEENHNCTNAPKQPIYNMLNNSEASLITEMDYLHWGLGDVWATQAQGTCPKLISRLIQHDIRKYWRKICTPQPASCQWDAHVHSNMTIIQNTRPNPPLISYRIKSKYSRVAIPVCWLQCHWATFGISQTCRSCWQPKDLQDLEAICQEE